MSVTIKKVERSILYQLTHKLFLIPLRLCCQWSTVTAHVRTIALLLERTDRWFSGKAVSGEFKHSDNHWTSLLAESSAHFNCKLHMTSRRFTSGAETCPLPWSCVCSYECVKAATGVLWFSLQYVNKYLPEGILTCAVLPTFWWDQRLRSLISKASFSLCFFLD